MIDKDKTYRTRDGREVRIYATDGGFLYPVHGAIRASDVDWDVHNWTADGYKLDASECSQADLIESDPHGILPRHRGLLASVYEEMEFKDFAYRLRCPDEFGIMPYDVQAALIALAKLDNERGGV